MGSNPPRGPMDYWKLVHRYRHLVRLGHARPFICPQCENSLQYLRDKSNEPVLWCPYDDSGFTPGTQFWADVNAVVTEFYVE